MDSAVYLQASNYPEHSIKLVCKTTPFQQRFFMFSGFVFSGATGSMCWGKNDLIA
jgi:hypothetical protein